jgi:hypothetical protein
MHDQAIDFDEGVGVEQHLYSLACGVFSLFVLLVATFLAASREGLLVELLQTPQNPLFSVVHFNPIEDAGERLLCNSTLAPRQVENTVISADNAMRQKTP